MLNDKIFTRYQLALAIDKISNILLIREEKLEALGIVRVNLISFITNTFNKFILFQGQKILVFSIHLSNK